MAANALGRSAEQVSTLRNLTRPSATITKKRTCDVIGRWSGETRGSGAGQEPSAAIPTKSLLWGILVSWQQTSSETQTSDAPSSETDSGGLRGSSWELLDSREGAHNPKVAGSNPAPATQESAGQSPPSREGFTAFRILTGSEGLHRTTIEPRTRQLG